MGKWRYFVGGLMLTLGLAVAFLSYQGYQQAEDDKVAAYARNYENLEWFIDHADEQQQTNTIVGPIGLVVGVAGGALIWSTARRRAAATR